MAVESIVYLAAFGHGLNDVLYSFIITFHLVLSVFFRKKLILPEIKFISCILWHKAFLLEERVSLSILLKAIHMFIMRGGSHELNLSVLIGSSLFEILP